MLDDILEFSATHLVDHGRLSLWMPTANDEDVQIAIPNHSSLKLVSVCVQPFNKCKRQILVILDFTWCIFLSQYRVEKASDISTTV